jgi:hypothetical protein
LPSVARARITTQAVTPQGTTTIEQGTLSIGDGINDGTILGNIINNGQLIYNRRCDRR